MIHAYNEYYLSQTQRKLGIIFELAVHFENLSIDEIANKFVNSKVCKAFETANPIYILGKSANELLGIVLDKSPLEVEQGMFCPPEYWTGHVLAYAQWYFNVEFKKLLEKMSSSEIVAMYFPYHEMDISHIIEVIGKRLDKQNQLKEMRLKRGLSQTELAKMSGVSLRSIKAYEQGTNDISKAQADTLLMLSRVLTCSIEDLIS